MDIPEKIQQLMKDANLDEQEATEAFEFVAKCVDAAADHLEEHEPYATNAIRNYRKIESDLHDFSYFVESNFSTGD